MIKLAMLLVIVLSNLCWGQDFLFEESHGILTVIQNTTVWTQVKPEQARVTHFHWLKKNILEIEFIDEFGQQGQAMWKIHKESVSVEITSQNNTQLAYPWPFVRRDIDSTEGLLLPVAEGIIYPACESSIKPYDWLVGYSGYGLTLPLFGMINNSGSGYGFFTEDPEYFRLQLSWQRQWVVTPTWEPGKTEFSSRKSWFRFFQEQTQEQGVVRIAKWYREYLDQNGYLKPLRKKNAKCAKSQELIAVPQVWVWSDPLETARFLDSLSINQALIANVDPKKWETSKKDLKDIHDLGFLTGRYDNYEDRWPEDMAEVTEWTAGWDNGLVTNRQGTHDPAWTIYDQWGDSVTGAKLCSRYGKDLIRESLKAQQDLPLKTRFIDTLPATELRECFHPDHPHDRVHDRKDRAAILEYSASQVLTGSEKGSWWAIKGSHYFMGMLSLGPYPPPLVENPSAIASQANPDYLRFNVGYEFRVPLFELVAHDCVLPTWFWGDGNNKHPGTWREKDLITVLYGGIPLWCFASLEEMKQYADSLRASYYFVRPGLEAIGMSEMLSFEFLTRDKSLQRVSWSNGAVICVNFKNRPQNIEVDGHSITIPAKNYYVVKKPAHPFWQWLASLLS